MIKSPKFIALQLLALALQLALGYTVYRVVGDARAQMAAAEARTHEIATRAAQVREFEYYRGIYSLCINLYNDPFQCNEIAANGQRLDVYHNARFSLGYEPAR